MSSDMAPKSDKHGPGTSQAEDSPDAADLQEIASVNNHLDELSTVLDQMENNTDNILTQLRELLESNREIRSQLSKLSEEVATEKVAIIAELNINDSDDATQDKDPKRVQDLQKVEDPKKDQHETMKED